MVEVARNGRNRSFQVLIVGCGRIGSAVALQLLRSNYFNVAVMDPTQPGRDRAIELDLPLIEAEEFGASSIQQTIQKYDAVVAAFPGSASSALKKLANASGVHYLDLSDQFEISKADQAGELSALDIPHCGVFPGLLTTLLMELLAGDVKTAEVDVMVGVLPREPTNRLGYGLVWDVDGLVREYTQQAPCIAQGIVSFLPALSNQDRVMIAGREYETFVSGSMSVPFLRRLEGKVNSLTLRTVRYPGHLDYIRFLTDDLKLRSRVDLLKLLLSNALPEITDDELIVQVAVTQQDRGLQIRQEYIKVVVPETDGDMRMTALQRTASSHVCAILDLIRQGVLPGRGRVDHENISAQLLRENRFLAWFFDGF